MASVKRIDKGCFSEIWIDRPEALNSLNLKVIEELLAEFKAISDKQKLVILRSSGDRSFVAGADIKVMQAMKLEELEKFASIAHELMSVIEKSKFLVLACIQGFAFGGGLELALACDLIVATNNAKFSLPELNLGLIPGFGGTQRLLQRCGIGFARRAIYTSEQYNAQQAFNVGLVDYLVNSEEFEAEISRISKIICSKSSESLDAAKKSIFKFNSDNLKKGLSFELGQFAQCFKSINGTEGLKAFVEKRVPEFK